MSEREPKFSELTPEEKTRERMETKLFLARDIEGEPNKEDLEKIRELEDALKKFNSFIGIGIFGSTMSGYENENSDLDIDIFYDSSLQTASEKEKFKDLCEELAKKFNIHVLRVDLNIYSTDAKNYKSEALMTKLFRMSRMVTGQKVGKYRSLFSERIRRFSEDEQKYITDKLMEILLSLDEASLEKREERLPGITTEEHEEILNERKEMWRKRVKKIWGIGGE
ncbi:MAG: nucleotidyltransferase domain-containing protein [Candidatus Staskawiczbacteria bacterium]|jgi:predicted nucleotidyltransferase